MNNLFGFLISWFSSGGFRNTLPRHMYAKLKIKELIFVFYLYKWKEDWILVRFIFMFPSALWKQQKKTQKNSHINFSKWYHMKYGEKIELVIFSDLNEQLILIQRMKTKNKMSCFSCFPLNWEKWFTCNSCEFSSM